MFPGAPSIKCGKCGNKHHTVNEVRNCYLGTNFPPGPGPTQPSGAAFLADDPREEGKRESGPTPPKREPVTEDGMYKLKGSIYKVQRAVHGSGHLYAKKLTQQRDGTWKFEYAPGAIRLLSAGDRMTLEQAQEFGHLYGVCCSCGAVLTNEESIEFGIGPVCRGKMGW